MADAMNGPVNIKFVDKRKDPKTNALTLTEASNFTSIAALKARLTALKPTVYTTARMHTMTVNDLVFALRAESADAAGIK